MINIHTQTHIKQIKIKLSEKSSCFI